MAATGVEHTVVELDLCGEERNGDVQRILKGLTGRTSVPNIIVSGASIGGGDEVEKLQRSGKLQKLLEEAECAFQDL